jgi:predicted DNA-binding transcriptional regulator YafY
MKYLENLAQLERIEALARKNATGTPKELAKKINVSERTIYRLIKNMKTKKIPIEFCRKRNSYFLNY